VIEVYTDEQDTLGNWGRKSDYEKVLCESWWNEQAGYLIKDMRWNQDCRYCRWMLNGFGDEEGLKFLTLGHIGPVRS
jgi:hypothetical protein